MQVVGGIDEQMPSLPSTTGVEVVSYSKLLSQVISFSPRFLPPSLHIKIQSLATLPYPHEYLLVEILNVSLYHYNEN